MTSIIRSWRNLPIILLISLMIFPFVSERTGNCSEPPLKLTILHMNDPHAHYQSYEGKGNEGLIGGFAKAYTVIKNAETANMQEGRETLVFLAGDLLMGTPFSTVFKGMAGVTLLNRMGITAMCVGNHEFDYGKENLLKTLKNAAQFPLLSANITTTDGEYVFQRTMEKRFAGSNTRALIVGLTTDQTPVTTHPANVKGLVFHDPTATMKEILKGVKTDDLVIALSHLGVDEDKKLAEACPRINVIIGGHSHTALYEPLKVNNTVICQAGSYSKSVGELDLSFEHGTIMRYQGRLIPLDDTVKDNPEIVSVINDYKQKLDGVLDDVIGKSKIPLNGNGRIANPGETVSLARIITFNMASSTGSDVATLNAGAIRKSLNEGKITAGDVYTALPFSDTVVKLGLTGEDLLEVLQLGAEKQMGSGGRLQTYGIDYRVQDGKVVIDSVAGHPFGPEKVYSVATNDFLAAGGDGYSILKEKGRDPYPTAMPVSDLVISYIKEKQLITQELIDELSGVTHDAPPSLSPLPEQQPQPGK